MLLYCPLGKRKKTHLPDPCFLFAVLCQQGDFLNDLSDRQRLPRRENACHWQADSQPFVRLCQHRIHIMGEQHTSVLCRPLQNVCILPSCQSNILYAHKVNT